MLLSIHMMLANMTGIEELNLSDVEAQQIAEATANVARFYDVEASEKTIAWVQLTFVLSNVYGTRAWAYSARKRKEEQEKRPRLVPRAMPEPQQQQPPYVPFMEQAAPVADLGGV